MMIPEAGEWTMTYRMSFMGLLLGGAAAWAADMERSIVPQASRAPTASTKPFFNGKRMADFLSDA